MKKVIASIIMVLMLAGISGCLQYGSGKPDQLNGSQTTEEPEARPLISEATEAKVSHDKDSKTDSGRYVGQADNNFIEVQISGVPDTKDFKVFMLSKELKKTFEALKLETGENIKFQYYVNDNNQNVIVSIEKI